MHIIKTLVFHLLMTFRGLVLFTSKILSIIFLTGFCALIFIQEFNAVSLAPKILALVFGILFTMINWFYDYLLIYLKPKILEVAFFR